MNGGLIMKTYLPILVVSMIFVCCIPAFAWIDHGHIAPGIDFDDLEVSVRGKVTGVIENETEEHICISASILFCGTGDKVRADAYVSCLDVPPDAEAFFDTSLRNGNSSDAIHAFKLKWIVKNITVY